MVLSRYVKAFDFGPKEKVIINTVTGAVDLVEKDFYDNLINGEFNDNYKDYYTRLEKRGYLVENYIVDHINLKMLVSKKKDIKFATFIICTTYSCNLGCTYCFEPEEVKESGIILTQEDVDSIFEGIRRIIHERGFEKAFVLLYGGEPFLESTKAIVEYILKKAKENDYLIRAITNGTNLYRFKDILQEYTDRIDGFQITLDGVKEKHNKSRKYKSGKGTFEDIVKNIDLCMDLKIPVALRVNTGKNNVNNILELIHFIKEKKWNLADKFTCQFAPVTDHFCTNQLADWMPEHLLLKEIYEQLDREPDIIKDVNIQFGSDIVKRTSLLKSILTGKKNQVNSALPCSAATRNYFIFGADGFIYACPETVGMIDYSIGSYKPYFAIEKEKERIWERDVSNIEKCSECNLAGVCGGGCIWSAINTNGKEFHEAQCNYAFEVIDTFFNMNLNQFKVICNGRES